MTLVNLKPSDEFQFAAGKGDVLLIGCGALGREIVDLIEANRNYFPELETAAENLRDVLNVAPDGLFAARYRREP